MKPPFSLGEPMWNHFHWVFLAELNLGGGDIRALPSLGGYDSGGLSHDTTLIPLCTLGESVDCRLWYKAKIRKMKHN